MHPVDDVLGYSTVALCSSSVSPSQLPPIFGRVAVPEQFSYPYQQLSEPSLSSYPPLSALDQQAISLLFPANLP